MRMKKKRQVVLNKPLQCDNNPKHTHKSNAMIWNKLPEKKLSCENRPGMTMRSN